MRKNTSSRPTLEEPIYASANLKAEIVQAIKKALASNVVPDIYIDKPYYLYLTKKQSEVYLKAVNNPSYADLIEIPLTKLIDQNKEDIVSDLASPITFIDLGPGYPDKSLKLIQAMKAKGIVFTYHAVDISPFFLNLTKEVMAKHGIKVITHNCLFEDIPHKLSQSSEFQREGERFVFLGLTFNNYELSEITSLLCSICRPGDYFFIAAQFMNGIGTSRLDITAPYLTEDAKRFNFLPLKNVNLNIDDFDYFVDYENYCIYMGFFSRHEIKVKTKVLPKGAKIITSRSSRYPHDVLVDYLSKFFLIKGWYKKNCYSVGVLRLKRK